MHILLQQSPPTLLYLLIKPKQTIRSGDILIFQKETDGDHIEETKLVVDTASAPDTDGLNKGYQVITFVQES